MVGFFRVGFGGGLLDGLGEGGPVAGEVGFAAGWDEDGDSFGWGFEGQGFGEAHLFEGLDGEVGSDFVGSGGAVLPEFEDEGSAGGGVVAAAVCDPGEAECAGHVEDVGVVADDEEGAVGGFAEGSWDGALFDGLFKIEADLVEESRGLGVGDGGGCAA